MKKIKLGVNIFLLPLSIATAVFLVLIEDPWNPIPFNGLGFNLKK